MGLTNDLRHRLTVYNSHEIELDTGETSSQYLPDKQIWGSLNVSSSKVENLSGDMERQNITHKLVIRPNACNLKTDTYFMYKNQKYKLLSWQPHYKQRDRIEIMLEMVVE